MIICKRCQVWTKSLKRWILMGYDTGARNPVSLRALSPSNTQKGKCETSKAQREQFVHRRDQNKETFSTSLLQVQWLKKTHLQDTLNNKASPLIYEQEGIKGKCSRTSNAICGSLPLNKKLITNNLWLTAAISLRLTLTDWNLINSYWSASGPFSFLFWTSTAYQGNALSLLQPDHSTQFCNAEC